jgi:hypothetical protein
LLFLFFFIRDPIYVTSPITHETKSARSTATI